MLADQICELIKSIKDERKLRFILTFILSYIDD